MQGKNPLRPSLKGDGSKLEVQNIYATIQGEGLRCGEPAIFIRLGGCNLACKFCDTEFESFKTISVDEIIKKVTEFSGDVIKLVVITGGEPFRQPIEKLCTNLLDKGYLVQIETNGTLYRDVDERVEITCSPKNIGNGYGKIRPDLIKRVNCLKFIISRNDDSYNYVPEIEAGNIPIFVQPMDELNEEKNRLNVEYARKVAMENGYRLSLQLHKILGIE